MEVTAKRESAKATDEQRQVRQLVMAGIKQVQEGKTMNFDEVCDRLEKKYTNAAV